MVWSFFPSENAAYKIDLAVLRARWTDAELERFGVLMNADPFQGADEEKANFKDRGKLGGVECYAFELPVPTVEGKVNPAEYMRIWVGIKDGVPRVQETFTKSHENLNRTAMQVREVDFATTAKDFEFTPPVGCKVEDVTVKVMRSLEERKRKGGP